MRLEILTALEEYSKAHDLALDWLIKSWELKGEDKQIAKLYYKKAKKESDRLARRLNKLCQKK